MTETAWTQKTLVQKILSRQHDAEQAREPYDDRFSEIVDNFEPGLTSWRDEDTEGNFRGERIYEGTPPWALRIMTAGWLGNLVSEALRWFKYRFTEPALKDNDEVNQHLQDREDHMYSVYQRSELYAALTPYTRFAFSVGSPVIIPYFDPKINKIKCEVPNPKENYHVPYQGYHRKFKMTALDAVMQFMNGVVPEAESESGWNLPLSRALVEDFKNGRHSQRHEFVRAIYQKDDPILANDQISHKNKPWMEFYVQTGVSQLEQNEPVKVDGYFTKPHIRWDYEINTDEIYARTPAWHAIQDTRSGQEEARQRMERGQRELNPPMWVQRKFRRRFNFRPGGRTYYDTADEAQLIPQSIVDRGNYTVGVDVNQMLIQNVERWFQVPFFSMLSRMATDQKAGWPTATHIVHLNAEKAVLLAPHIGRFTNVIRQVDDRCQDIERRRGSGPLTLSAMPQILQDYFAFKKAQGDRTVKLDVEFIGPLAQMQQQGLTIGRVESGLQIQRAFMEIDPLLVHKTRNSVAMEKALEQVGYPQDAIVPESEFQETLAAIAEQEAQEKQMEHQSAAAGMVPNLSGTIEPGSPLNQMMEAGQEV